jgi:succinate dehydrogenase / fumarate reductase cytochrome b subunit
MSPHLQVWRWHWTMAASIAHRVTGIGNYLGVTLIGLWIVALAAGAPVALPDGPLGLLFWAVLYLFTVSVTYHLLNGIRHLVWDSGHGFDPDLASKVSVAIFAIATLKAAGALYVYLLWAGVL